MKQGAVFLNWVDYSLIYIHGYDRYQQIANPH